MTSLKKQSFLSGHTQSCVFLATTIDNGNSLQAISFLLCIWLRRNSFRLHLIKCKCCIIYERKLNFIKLIPQEAVHVKKKINFSFLSEIRIIFLQNLHSQVIIIEVSKQQNYIKMKKEKK